MHLEHRETQCETHAGASERAQPWHEDGHTGSNVGKTYLIIMIPHIHVHYFYLHNLSSYSNVQSSKQSRGGVSSFFFCFAHGGSKGDTFVK